MSILKGNTLRQSVTSAQFWRQYAPMGGILLLTVLVRSMWLSFPGFGHDIEFFMTWSGLAQHDLWHIYSDSLRYPDFLPGSNANYPPGMMVLLLIVRTVYQVVVGVTHGVDPTTVPFDEGHPSAVIFYKVCLIACDVVTTWLIFALVRARASHIPAYIAAALYALSPAIIYDGAIWGQVDGLASLLLLGVLWYAHKERPVLAGIMLAIMVMVKVQPVVVVPLFIIWVWRVHPRPQALRVFAATLGTALLFIVPFLVVAVPGHARPEALQFVHNVLHVESVNTTYTYDAYNLWYLLGLSNTSAGMSIIGPITGNLIGTALFAGALGMGGILLWRKPNFDMLVGTFALATLAFFLFTTTQHERYIVPSLLPFILFVPTYFTTRVAAIVVQMTAFLNIVLTHPLPIALTPLHHDLSHFPARLPLGVAFLNLMLFAALVVELLRQMLLMPLEEEVEALPVTVKRKAMPLYTHVRTGASTPLHD